MNHRLKSLSKVWEGRLGVWLAAVFLAALASCGGGGQGDAATVSPNDSSPTLPAVGQLELVVGGVGGRGNLDGLGRAARFASLGSVVVDSAGDLYVGDNTIRKISAAGVVTTLAARFDSSPGVIARDVNGNLLVADGQTIRKVSPSGVVSTVAVDVPYLNAIAVTRGGQIFGVRGDLFCSTPTGPCRIQDSLVKITLSNDSLKPLIEPISGLDYPPSEPGRKPAILLSVANTPDNDVLLMRLHADDGPAGIDFFQLLDNGNFERVDVSISAKQVQDLCGACNTNELTRIYFAAQNNRTMTAVFTQQPSPYAARSFVGVGKFSVGKGEHTIQTNSNYGSANGALAQAGFRKLSGIAVNAQGVLYVVDAGNSQVRGIDPSGVVSTLAGLAPDATTEDELGPKQSESALFLSDMCEVGVSRNGAHAYLQFCEASHTFVEQYYRVRGEQVLHRLGDKGIVNKIRLSDNTGPSGFGVDDQGDVYTADRRHAPDGALKFTWLAPNDSPISLTVADGEGGALTARGGQLFRLRPDSKTPQFLAGRASGSAVAVDGAASSAGFAFVRGLAVDGPRQLAYVSDQDGDGNSRVRKIAANGQVSTLAGQSGGRGANDGSGATATFREAQGLAVDRKGNIYVADTGNHTIRKITPEGVVSTVVGQAGKAGVSLGALPGRLTSPTSVAIDDNNVLYIATPAAVLRVRMPE